MLIVGFALWGSNLLAENSSPLDSLKKNNEFNLNMGDAPTYIKSKTLTLKANEHVFVYSGNVDVLHGDMHMTCDEVEGYYTENNQISKLVAHGNVVMVKGNDIRATCQKAVYSQVTETITLTENPELLQNGSVLSADAIVVHMKTNQSEAQGNVRVKLISQKKDKSILRK